MTREDAISHVLHLSGMVEGEFCCSDEESRRSEQKTTDALLALGVSLAEIGGRA